MAARAPRPPAPPAARPPMHDVAVLEGGEAQQVELAEVEDAQGEVGDGEGEADEGVGRAAALGRAATSPA